MLRRVLLAGMVAALAVGGVPAFAAAPACVVFSDPLGDGAISDSDVPTSVPANDPALDVTKVRFASTAKALVATVRLDKLNESRATYAPGSRVQAVFNVRGHEVVVYYKFSATRAQEANAYRQQGIRVDGVFASAVLVGEVKGNDVTMTVKYADLKPLVGGEGQGEERPGQRGRGGEERAWRERHARCRGIEKLGGQDGGVGRGDGGH